MSKTKQRTIYGVQTLIERRYGIGDTLAETFLDHECIHTLETLISYGPKECGGTDSTTWKEYMHQSDNGKLNLEAARFGAYSTFIKECEKSGIDAEKAWNHFSNAAGYYGTELQGYEELERAGDSAASYIKDGMRFLKNMRARQRRKSKRPNAEKTA